MCLLKADNQQTQHQLNHPIPQPLPRQNRHTMGAPQSQLPKTSPIFGEDAQWICGCGGQARRAQKTVHFFGRIRSGFGSVVVKLGGKRTSVRNRQRDPATGSKTQGTEPKKQPTTRSRHRLKDTRNRTKKATDDAKDTRNRTKKATVLDSQWERCGSSGSAMGAVDKPRQKQQIRSPNSLH